MYGTTARSQVSQHLSLFLYEVDVIQFQRSESGKKYAVVFTDYLTKWPEVFATEDQTSQTC